MCTSLGQAVTGVLLVKQPSINEARSGFDVVVQADACKEPGAAAAEHRALQAVLDLAVLLEETRPLPTSSCNARVKGLTAKGIEQSPRQGIEPKEVKRLSNSKDKGLILKGPRD